MLLTLRLILLRPSLSLMVPASPLTATTAPGCFVPSYTVASGSGNISFEGMGKKEPYRAFSRSPSSLEMGWWTVTRYVPMGKVPSTIISESDATTEGCTWRRPSMVLPMDMRSATEWLPSRMSCMRSGCGSPCACGQGVYLLQVIRNQCLRRVSGASITMLHCTYRCFRMVQFHASRKTALCKQAKLRDDELVELIRGLVWGARGAAVVALASLGHNCIVSMASNSQENTSWSA
jgi:hypothetical protein